MLHSRRIVLKSYELKYVGKPNEKNVKLTNETNFEEPDPRLIEREVTTCPPV